jgi:hypothetical protein
MFRPRTAAVAAAHLIEAKTVRAELGVGFGLIHATVRSLPPACHDCREQAGTSRLGATRCGTSEPADITHEIAQGRATPDVFVSACRPVRIPLGSQILFQFRVVRLPRCSRARLGPTGGRFILRRIGPSDRPLLAHPRPREEVLDRRLAQPLARLASILPSVRSRPLLPLLNCLRLLRSHGSFHCPYCCLKIPVPAAQSSVPSAVAASTFAPDWPGVGRASWKSPAKR